MLWIRNDKTGELYQTKAEAARKLGISHKYVRELSSGRKRSSKYKLSIYDDGIDCPKDVSRKQEMQSRDHRTVHTKCCDCDNYHCSWIQRFEPVPGWDAVEVPENNSYLVRTCPLYQENPRRRKEKE